jgi:hypothetical protein
MAQDRKLTGTSELSQLAEFLGVEVKRFLEETRKVV